MSVSEPGKIITPWAESGLKNPIPPAANPATGRAGFDQGFSAINMTAKEAGGIPPFGQDFNGIFYEVTSILRYMQAGGQPTFDAALATAIGGYPKGAVVIGDDGMSLFRNTVDGNSTNPNLGGDGWARPDLQVMELYRRSYAEAGYNLVAGSFEAGGALVNANDVLLQERTGKAYTGPAGTVAAGTDPASGGFVDRSNQLLSIWAGSIDAKYFGVDTTGVLPSDNPLADALAFSAVYGVEIVISGKCRITTTVNQPLNSVVRCDGVVYCTDGALLTDGWMWVVDAIGNVNKRTEIRTLTLATASDTDNYIDLPIKGLRVSSPKVVCGVIRTFGLIMGGVEFGPTGFEITADGISNTAKAWTPASRGTPGLKITTTDCMVQRHFCVGYSVGGDYGSASYVGAAHVWGLPANNINQYPNRQMLTGVIFGASTVVDYIYADTIDTDGYDTPASGNDGYCVVFYGWENKIGTLLYMVHGQSKPAKVKVAKFKGKTCEVNTVIKASGSIATADPAIDYVEPDGPYKNIIKQINGVKSNQINYGTTLPPTGFTTFTGYQVVRTSDRMFETRIFHNATAVDATSSNNFAIPLPPGLAGSQGATGVVSIRTCVNLGAIDVNIGDVFAVLDGNGININLAYVRKDTGAQVFIKQNQLRPGSLQLVLHSSYLNY